jgi:hypothetical protein
MADPIFKIKFCGGNLKIVLSRNLAVKKFSHGWAQMDTDQKRFCKKTVLPKREFFVALKAQISPACCVNPRPSAVESPI